MSRRYVLALLLVCGSACMRDERPSVVLITLDTTRADRLGFMGDATARTPVLDALAARGVVFERAYSSVPLTLPSHTTLLTGLDPNQHGVHDNGDLVPASGLATVAERLREAGYDTGAFVAAFVLDSRFALDRGFDRYDDDIEVAEDPLSFAVPQRSGDQVTDRALAWLAEREDRPFFLWAHYYDVHAPREPPPPYDAIEDEYAGAIAFADAQVGRLIEGVAQAAGRRPTLILVTADHGESLGAHDEATHGIVAYDSSLHVPLVAVGPGFVPGSRSTSFVSTADVAPTIVAALGLPAFERSDGRSLLQIAAGGSEEERLGYFESRAATARFGWAPLAGVRTARWKYTGEPAPAELYDVLADPGETANRAQDEADVTARLRERFEALRPAIAPAPEALPLDLQEKLAALGYAATPQRFEPGRAPDPRRVVGALGLVDTARAMVRDGEAARGIRALEILRESPAVRALALRNLVPAYLAVGRAGDAVTAARTYTELVTTLEARVVLAQALVADDHAEEALQTLDGVERRTLSRYAELLRVRALLLLGRKAEAEAAAGEILAEDPWNDAAIALESLARTTPATLAAEIDRLRERIASAPPAARLDETRLLLAGKLARAEGREAAVQSLRSIASPTAGQLALLAELARDAGDPEAAIAALRGAVAEEPAERRWRLALADLRAAEKQWAEAIADYDTLVELTPRDAALRVARGIARMGAGRPDAASDFEAALDVDPKLAEAHLNLGLIAARAKRPADAEREWRRALEIRPDYAKARFFLAELDRARAVEPVEKPPPLPEGP